MDFKTFMEGFNVTPPTSINSDSKPVEVLTYIKSKGTLDVTPSHPDEWEVDEDCVGEIEDFRNLAEKEQEVEEARWEAAVNNPDHPDHKAEWEKLNAEDGKNA